MTLSLEQKPKEMYLKAFLIPLGLSALFFLPFIILDHGYFFFFGDFNVQQIPFYKLAHEAIKSGDLYWNWYTDLGTNFIGSYSFYLLGSPFFWLTIPFPTSFVPYLMAPLFCLKFATASLTSYMYITRFVKNKHFVLLSSLLYAFSGFSIYNIFFNHFHECIAFFPLLLIGLEKAMMENKKGLFAAAVFINALVNYFFFVGEVVFLIIYFVCRVKSGAFKLTVKKFSFLAFESVIGFCLTGFLMLPSIMAILSNPRLENFNTGWGSLLYSEVQRYPQIIQAFFFPPELPSQPNFFPDANVKWSSVAGWLPFVGMSGVISFLMDKRKHFVKNIIYTSILFAMVPILNSSFYAFNTSYYARWFYMPILMMALATAVSMEDKQINIAKGMQISSNITILFILIIGLFPSETDGELSIGLENVPIRFLIYSVIAITCCVLLVFIYKNIHKNQEKYIKYLTIATCVTIVIYSAYFIGEGKSFSYETDYIINTALNARDNFDLPDDKVEDQFYRVDVFKGMDNQAMFWHMPTIQAFHSVVPGSIMEFYPSIGVTRDVGSRPDDTHVALRPLTSVKYLFARASDNNPNVIIDTNGVASPMPGYAYLGYQNGFHIFDNENYIPMGFTYDLYIPRSTYDSLDVTQREWAMLTAIVFENENEYDYAHLFTEANYNSLISINDDNFQEVVESRKSSAAYYFSHDNHGFTSKIVTAEPDLVFFSIPYEDGWSATVNGQSVPVEKVNVGFMAVPVNAGESEIRFTFTTPGLYIGIMISWISAVLFMSYLLTNRYIAYKQMGNYIDGSQEPDADNEVQNTLSEISPTEKIVDDEDDEEIVSPSTVQNDEQNQNTPYKTVIEDMPDGEFHEGQPNRESKSHEFDKKTRSIINNIIEDMDNLRHLDKNYYKDPTEDDYNDDSEKGE